MKKIIGKCAAIFAAAAVSGQNVYASGEYIRLSGYTDSNARGVTVLVLDKNTDINNIQNENIKYINEGKINSDGTYSIKLPISLDYENADVRSNMSGFNMSRSDEERTKTVYVSADGNDLNSGENTDEPLRTLGAAYGKLDTVKKIVLMSDTEYFPASIAYDGMLEIEGYTGNEKLTLPSSTDIKGNTKLDKLAVTNKAAVFANGNKLVIGEGITTAERLTVYGGTNGSDYSGDTDITLLGGKYAAVYGGSKGADVSGSTNVLVGGKVNKGDHTDDETSDGLCPCYVYGGSENGDVGGKTNVTLDGNAVAAYISGGGSGGYSYVTDTNIYIKGGKVINVYGGSVDGTLLENCNTHITMTGGLAEGIFGGSIFNSLKGNTYIRLVSGDVSRRVFTGCYNDWRWDWLQTFRVYGTTNMTIYPDIKLNTKTELSSGNRLNIGVFAGSRQGLTQFAEEINTVIFAGGCYDAQKNNMGDVSGWNDTFGNFQNYTVESSANGEVLPTAEAGILSVLPNTGYYAKTDGKTYVNGRINAAENTVTSVEFKKDFVINSLNTADTTDGITADVGLSAKNITNHKNPKIIAAVYDENGKLEGVSAKLTNSDNDAESLDIKCLESGKSDFVRAMIWDEAQQPLTAEYKITVKKN